MKVSAINPYIRVAKHSVLPAGLEIKTRAIYDYELLYLEKGEFTLLYNGEECRCKKGDLILIHPGVTHSFHIDNGEISQPHIHFDMVYRPESKQIPVSFKNTDKMTETEKGWIHRDNLSSEVKSPFITVRERESFLKIFYRILSRETDELTKKGLLLQLISFIIKDNYPSELEEQKNVSVAEQIRDYIDAGNGFSMSLNDFEKSFFYSKFYLEKRFKEAFGIGIIEYKNKKRMEIASVMLKENSVTETAEKLGFSSVYSFSRAYKSYYGIPPSKQ